MKVHGKLFVVGKDFVEYGRFSCHFYISRKRLLFSCMGRKVEMWTRRQRILQFVKSRGKFCREKIVRSVFLALYDQGKLFF